MDTNKLTPTPSDMADVALPGASDEKSGAQKSLVVLGAAVGLGSGFAPMYFSTLSVFLKPVAAEFSWGRAETAGAGVLSMLGLAIGSVLVGRCIDRFGPSRIILASVALMALLINLLARVGNDPFLFGGLSFLIGVVGAATTPPGYLSVLAMWFNKRLGLALGLAGVGMGVGTVLAPMITQGFIGQYGWRGAYIHLSLWAAACGALACILIFLPRNHRPLARSEGTGHKSSVLGETVSEALRSGRFWLLSAVILVVSASSLGVSIHLVSLVTDLGVSASDGARVAAVTGVGVVLGRLVCGVVLDMYPAPRIAALSFALASAGTVLLASGAPSGFASVALCGLMVGFAIGAEGDFIPFFVRRYFGLRAFGSIYGLLFFAFAIGGLLGPVAFGASFDGTQSYAQPLWVAATGLALAAVAVLRLGPYHYASPHSP
ncbi:MFS transporter [Hydrogenophaga pseudoflava]|uniref:MFS transporter n=1 Tax=Hydrogenophaga pseudoflava TaxID=47421 RepID=UPI0027E4DFBF|nr:MFS transporter [Hydrogenophaga pseudoflava]MDQ7747409.1 MFS transporter [Hydrogenophaga pseudoflava]